MYLTDFLGLCSADLPGLLFEKQWNLTLVFQLWQIIFQFYSVCSTVTYRLFQKIRDGRILSTTGVLETVKYCTFYVQFIAVK